MHVHYVRWNAIFTQVLLATTLLMLGCTDHSTRSILQIQQQMEEKQDNAAFLEEAFRDLPKMAYLERRLPTAEITKQLNSWASKQSVDPQWAPTPLLTSLPELVSNSDWGRKLNTMQFSEQHAEYLFQSTLMRDVSAWVLQQPYRDGIFLDWLEQKKKSLTADEGMRLEQALKLFDWTIRNIEVTGSPKDIETLPASPFLPLTDDALGYTMLPWQTLMRANGDPIARARVFSLLAFQSGIPVSWLAFPGNSEDKPKLWLLGVPIGKDIYLLEPRFGLPLPGPNQSGVATLKEAESDATVLRRATLVDQFNYPVTASEVPKAIALLDLEPLAMSQCMQVLEKSLTGSMRVKLQADAAKWAQEFQLANPKLTVKLWSMPWIGLEYAKDVRQRLKTIDAFTANYMANMAIYMEDSLVSRARRSHFAGKFDSSVEEEGALGQYMALRIDDETLDQLSYDPDLQKQFLLRRSSAEESPEQFQQRIRFMQNAMRRAKYEGCVYLSMAHYDLGNFDSARSWADRWTLQVPGTEAWHSTCWYLTGRALESLGKADEAIEFYKKSPSPQEAGNRIRARLLNDKR